QERPEVDPNQGLGDPRPRKTVRAGQPHGAESILQREGASESLELTSVPAYGLENSSAAEHQPAPPKQTCAWTCGRTFPPAARRATDGKWRSRLTLGALPHCAARRL